MVATEPFIGREVLRKEDPDLLTGQASYVDNQTMPGMLWMALVRPPYVHATVDAIDTAAAEAMPGVVGVYTAADLELGGLPFVWPITEDIKVPVHYPLTKDKIRFHGDAVAVVLAESREQAADAAELVSVTVTELPAVTDMEAAMAEGAPMLHEELGTNVTVHWDHGGGGDASVFETAPGHRARALPPAAADPQRDRAARVPRVRHPGDGRVDARERHADPAHREGDALRRGGHPGVQVPGDRTRRGRRVRLEVERLRRGGPRARAGQAESGVR